ncbi:hypothetical protein L9F63_025003, partial [Diploptera punctata]
EKEDDTTYGKISDSFIERRTELTEKRQTEKRRINVTPGKSISATDLQSSLGVNKPAAPESSSKRMRKSSRQKTQQPETSDESDAESVVYAESNDSWNETDSASGANVIPAFR